MTVTTDSKKRVPLPAQPGSRFDVQAFGEDKFILTRLAPVQPQSSRPVIVKRNGYSVGKLPHKINATALQEALNEFP